MKNIALLLDASPVSWSSREEFHARLCAALRQRGSAPLVLLSDEPGPEIRRRFEAAGAAVVALPYRGVSARYVRALDGLIRKHDITAAYIRYFDYFSALPWILKLKRIRKIILTEANSGEWRPRPLTGSLVRLRARLATAPVSRLIAISDFVRRRMIATGLDARKIAVVHNGVDVERYSPDADARASMRQAHGMAPDDFVLSFIAVLRPFKHPETAIEALAILARERRLPVRMLFAGDGPMRPGLEALAARLGVGDRVAWLGHSSEPWRVLQASDAFVFASEGEAFGFVAAEAMACGVPVVAARSGALPEVVEDGRTGLLAEPANARDFADKLAVLVENRDLGERYGRAALDRARTHFGIEAAVARTLKVYDGLDFPL